MASETIAFTAFCTPLCRKEWHSNVDGLRQCSLVYVVGCGFQCKSEMRSSRIGGDGGSRERRFEALRGGHG